MPKLADLRRARAQTKEKLTSLKREYVGLVKREAELSDGEKLPEADRSKIDELMDTIGQHEETLRDHDERITRAENALQFEADNSNPVDDPEGERGARPGGRRTAASARRRDHESDPSLCIGAIARMMVAGGGTVMGARQAAIETLGERHPATEILHGARGFAGAPSQRAMMAGVGASGGFLVPPDYVAELIEVLRPMTVVRDSNPRMIEMPRGTMQMPRQTQAATASYGGETSAIPVSQQSTGQIVASYKKLTAMTPITNDLIRYSDPAVDALVRDDLAKVIARREDLAFIRGDGTSDSPRGFRSYVLPQNTIASNAAYTLTTAAQEIGGALNTIESANVPMSDLVWIMHPRSKNYLLNVQNANGFYVYREEMTLNKTLLGWPFKTTTQIPINLTVGGNSDCSEVYLVSMEQALLFDSMRLELAVSREGTYTDANNNLVSVFQQDQTLIRGIAEHDFHMRHDEAIALLTGVRWAPAIS
ncbi:MAG: phage major capsid protein [Betaproteobacteria bacterium]|nr:phage major capsid protein [Betaproteobacteria bacterium]